jgi:glutaredoxin
MTLVLLTAPDCHLCEHAHEVLAAIAAERDLSWCDVSVDSSEGRRLAAAAPPLRPVLFASDGHILGYGRLSAKRLRRELDADAAGLQCTTASR